MSLFFCGISFAQTTISGTVKDSKNQPIAGANVKIVGENSSTNADFDGTFTLKSSKASASVEVTMVGYTTKRTQSTTSGKLEIVLQAEETKLNEIVVSASRTPERVLESPVTIERMTLKDIKKSGSPTFYDGLENMKEVQMNTSSLSFKSINTRGFATVANTRFMQLVDGMDNSSPLLNFVLGNLVGISEIDVQSVELLPGASSALYGANAFNGILFMTSKNPFTSEGITAYAKYGQTSQVAGGNNGFFDNGVRVAKAFSKHFAAKANFSILSGTDWWATDYNDTKIAGIDRTNPGYNGINVYGDEAKTNIKGVAQGLFSAGILDAAQLASFNNILPDIDVSRTGYNEVDLTDNKVKNTKADFSLHLRPTGSENLEVIWQSKFGFGNTVYTGANRYYLNNFFMQQHKLEVKGKDFFLRGYTTTEDGGRSYDMLFTGLNVNRAAKADATWFGQYANAYVQSTIGGQLPTEAHATARNYADNNIRPDFATTGILLAPATGLPRFKPGTSEFKNAFNKVISDPDVLTGSKLVDNSRIYHSDANYNFRQKLVKFAEIQVGGSFRLYELNSGGRIYTDKDSQINYNEYGTYLQARSKAMDDRLKIAASVRYDKAKNFNGNFSPRVSFVYSAGKEKNHNVRASFQTGFRNPTTQDQYIGFNVGSAVLVGSAPDNLLRYTETRDVSGATGQLFAGGLTTILTGENAYNNSYTSASALQFAAAAAQDPSLSGIANAASLLRKSNAKAVQPETVKAFELGYRTQIKDFSIDLNGYFNTYNKFIGNLTVVAPYYGIAVDSPNFAAGAADQGFRTVQALLSRNTRNYQLYTNTDIEIKSIGFGAGISKKVYREFELGANYNYAQFDFDQSKDPSFEAGFNTPKHRIKVSLGNEKLFKNFGFNISGRWNSSYKWESTFVDGVIAEAKVLDAQINYTIPSLKSTLKIGAANIGGPEYRQVVGAGLIGQQYFASWTINP